MGSRFGFVVHALSPLHRAAIGVRAANVPMVLHRDDGTEADRITTLCTLRLGALTGTVIAIPLTPDQLLADQELALVRMVQAVERLAPVDAVGLGSLCAVVAGRGEALAARSSVPVTTGGAATAWALAENTRAVLASREGESSVAVVGARSPVGQAVAQLLASSGVTLRLDSKRSARGLTGATGFSSPAEAVEGCSVIVGAGPTGGTLAAAAVLPGASVIDVAIQGTIVGKPPEGVQIWSGEAVGTPPGWSARGWGRLFHLLAGYGLSQVYACLIEPLVMASLGRQAPLALGRRLSLEAVETFGAEAQRLGFRPVLLPEHGLRRWL